MKIKNNANEMPSDEVRHWLGEIASSKKREKDYRKNGEEIIKIYNGERPNEIPFNILFSNTETLLPALFSQTPRPVVQRRFKDEDPIGKAAAIAAQRMLEFLCDTNIDGYETFEQAVRNATLDALLPGRGITSVKYDADIVESGDGYQSDQPGDAYVSGEQICTDSKSWDRVYFGYAKKWSKVPWVAYEQFLDEQEAKELFGADISSKIIFTTGEEEEDEKDEDKGTGTGGKDDELGGRKTALIYQIWDKAGGKKIKYISPAYADGYLKEEDDPMGLTGFFNCPRPLQFIEKSNDLMPTAMYKLYENQAKELNNITRRLQRVVNAIKVRGAYDGSLGSEIEAILKEDDNGLVPTDKGASLMAEGGLEKAIWLMPLEKLTAVASNLFAAREQTKRVIYEITGVSDIIRGQSMASETLGAQKIKESWGTMRLKRLQKEVQRYARDILRIMLELAASKMGEETWARATGLPYTTQPQRQQAQMIIQAARMSGQQPDPQAMQVMQAPSWEAVLSLLQDDLQRAYRIDIETNSTIDAEATEDQKNIGDFMNAMGQLMAGLTPMVETGAMPFEGAQSLMLAVIRRFRFGTEVEDHFKNMQAPQKGNPQAEAAQQEAAKVQQETQAEMAKLQQASQEAIAKLQQEAQQAQLDRQAEMEELKFQLAAQHEFEQQKLQADHFDEMAKIKAQFDMEISKQQNQRSIEQMKANIQRDTEIKKAEMIVAGNIEIAKIQCAAKSETQQQ